MPEKLLNTREVASLLQINDKQVYRLIRGGGIPCTRVTGKWLFPQGLVEEWVQRSARGKLAEASRSLAVIERFGLDQGLLVAGSDDLLLGALFALMRQRYPEYVVYVTNLGSFGGMEALRFGKAHVALCHLRDPDSGEYNIPFLKRSFSADTIVAVTLWHRRVGFLHHPNSPSVESFADLRRRALRFVNRQRGSGVRWLIEQGLQEAKIAPTRLKGYDVEVWTHWEVGLTVLRHQADVGVATESVARLFGLGFHEIAEERFDLLVSKEHYFMKPVQALLATLTSSELRARATALGGYDVREIGKVAFPG
ncbi:MAG: helix-turn-helix domain-containing protein [Deltaproteobacteria bacterium]|nr:helix-turn-helix domain-containing protein [Deltaproteobacteria bacterium]